MNQKLNAALAPHDAALLCEDPDEIARVAADFHAEHSPAGPTEEFLVEQLARAAWRTRRLGRIEHSVIGFQMALAAHRSQCELQKDPTRTDSEIHLDNSILMGAAFHEDCDQRRRAQETIARMQEAAERSFLRCLKALHAEQDRRCKALSVPAATAGAERKVSSTGFAAAAESVVREFPKNQPSAVEKTEQPAAASSSSVHSNVVTLPRGPRHQAPDPIVPAPAPEQASAGAPPPATGRSPSATIKDTHDRE
ncbi:MAG: hypothetical protein ABI165_17520 [Bryobacteraceae bacterium]